MQSIIGKKLYQSSGFLEDGTRVPLTAVATKGNVITQIKTEEKEGYSSLQVGFGDKKKAKKREINHSKKAGLSHTPRFLREERVEDTANFELGKEVLVAEVLQPGDIIDAIGTSKGKGYAGVVKRHNFRGGPRTHGQSDRERAPGSIGQSTTPGRVYKGKRMAGRMGHERVTIKNLEAIEITEDGVVLVKGLIPGSVNSIVTLKKIGENKKFIPLYKEVKEEPQEAPKEETAPTQEEKKTEEPKNEIKQEELPKEEEKVEENKTEEESKEEDSKEEEKKEEVKEENANS